jgi:hypothetical protein
MDQETEFLLKRAREEARLAIQAKSEAAAEAHQGMAVRYSAKAVVQLTNEEPEISPAPAADESRNTTEAE